MKFGKFDDANREYVITTPKTPLPWINYLGSTDFFSLISNTGGGYSFYKDAKLLRLTRYRYNNIPNDEGGRYFYIKDGDTVWNPGWMPVKTDLDSYECRHGMGYTRFISEKDGINANLLTFVPVHDNCEINEITITNTTDCERTITLFSYIEFCLWNAMDDMTNFQRNLNTGEVEIIGSRIYHKTEYRERRNHYAVFAVNHDIDGFDTSRDAFLGAYRSAADPLAIEQGNATDSIASGWYPIGSHQINLTLKPGECETLVFVLGYCENDPDDKFEAPNVINKKPADELLNKYQTKEQVSDAFHELNEHWNRLLSHYTVKSGDEKLNRMVNIWNQYQCMVTFNMSRSASYFESGIGRGMGFRDSNQDLLGFVHQIPDRARERLIDLASTQFEDGGCYHQYQPLTKKGNNEIGGDFSDDPLWMILSVAAYIKESGDYSILDAKVPYDNDENKAKTMMDHLEKSFYHVFENVGPHGLPLAMRADWNDCINLSCFSDEPGESFQTSTSPKYGEDKYSKVAESMMVAALFTYAGPEYVAMCRLKGDDAAADKAQAAVDKMKDNIMKYGWDGEWFLRAYDDFGKKMGSHECEEGKIFIEPQGFAVMGGCGKETGADLKALESVDKWLNSEHGLSLNQPAFTKYYIQYGEISTYPAGYKENAGIFCHNNAWIICAEAFVGHGDKAFEYYSKIAPAYREEKYSDLHRTEPYVYAQMIAGKDAKRHGEAKNSWLTGTAAWNFVAVSQYILGIIPDWNGLKIDPSIPHEWDGFTATRQFRGASYEVTVKNPDHVCKGVKSVTVDGKAIEGNVLPVFGDGKAHTVEVVMG